MIYIAQDPVQAEQYALEQQRANASGPNSNMEDFSNQQDMLNPDIKDKNLSYDF
jgi:hypothetical protein